MAKQTPAERFSLDNQMIVRLRDLRSAKRDHQLACLELAQQDTPERAHVVAELEREIAGHELAIERLNAAKSAQANVDVETDNTAKLARLAELNAQRDAAVARAKQVPVELVDYIAQIGAMWTASHNTLSEAAALTREIVRLAGGKDAVKRFDNGADNAGHGALAAAVGSALAATGMGSTGPTLAPIVHVSPPMRAYTASDLERGLDNLFNRQVEAIDRATTTSKETA